MKKPHALTCAHTDMVDILTPILQPPVLQRFPLWYWRVVYLRRYSVFSITDEIIRHGSNRIEQPCKTLNRTLSSSCVSSLSVMKSGTYITVGTVPTIKLSRFLFDFILTLQRNWYAKHQQRANKVQEKESFYVRMIIIKFFLPPEITWNSANFSYSLGFKRLNLQMEDMKVYDMAKMSIFVRMDNLFQFPRRKFCPKS